MLELIRSVDERMRWDALLMLHALMKAPGGVDYTEGEAVSTPTTLGLYGNG